MKRLESHHVLRYAARFIHCFPSSDTTVFFSLHNVPRPSPFPVFSRHNVPPRQLLFFFLAITRAYNFQLFPAVMWSVRHKFQVSPIPYISQSSRVKISRFLYISNKSKVSFLSLYKRRCVLSLYVKSRFYFFFFSCSNPVAKFG